VKQNKLYAITVIDDPEGPTVRVKPSEYLVERLPHEAVAELKAHVKSLEDDLARYSEAFSDEELKIPENFEKVRKLEFELQIAQNYLIHLKEWSKSIKYVDFEKDNVDWFELGPEIFGQEQFEEIINDALKDVNENELFDEGEAYFQSGNRNFQQGYYQRAEQDYKKAIQVDPNISDAHYDLGLVYYTSIG